METNNIIWEEKNCTIPTTKETKPENFDNFVITTETKTELKKEILKNTTIPKTSGIYKIVNKINGKYYVGSAQNLYRRWMCGHRPSLNSKTHRNIKLQNAWIKYGEENFEFQIIENIPVDQLFIVEQKYLDVCKEQPELNYNLAYDAIAPARGRKDSEETKQKKRNSHKNISDETRKKLSIAGKGKIISEEQKLKIGLFHKGKIVSEETKQKLREARLKQGKIPLRKWTDEQRKEFRDRMLGKVQSDVAKEKCRQANLGRVKSEETKQKLRIANLGKTISEETKQKLREINTGKSLSEETKRKISESLKRVKALDKSKKSDIIIS